MENSKFVTKSVVLVLVTLFSHAALAAAKAGQVSLIKGDVFVVDPTGKVVADPEGKNGRRKFIQGADFFVGETVQTKPSGRVKLKFLEAGNEVTLGPSTSLVIERAGSGGKEKGTTLNLLNGDVRSDVKGKYAGQGSDTYEVKTKNAVAGVRGTAFLVQFEAKTGNFTAATEKGAVAVSSVSNKSLPAVLVGAGKFTSGTSTGVFSPPAPIASNAALNKTVSVMAGTSSSSDSQQESGTTEGGDRGTASDGGGEKKDNGGASNKDSQTDKGSDSKGSDRGDQASSTKAEGDGGGGDGRAPLGREPVVAKDGPSGGTEGRAPASASAGGPPPMMGPSMRGGQGPAINPGAMLGNIMNNVNNAQNNVNQNNNNQNQKARVSITIGP
jgi:hypothetical protein